MSAASLPHIESVAVVDTDPHILSQMVRRVELFGYHAIPISSLPSRRADAVSLIRDAAHFAVCDQKMEGIPGAELVSDLVAQSTPAILVSQYKNEAIPDYRHLLDRIPRFITRSEFLHDDLRSILSCVEHDIHADLDERRAYKALIRVEEVLGGGRLIVVIPAWSDEELEMSINAIVDGRDVRLEPGTRLFGKVNLHAQVADDVFIKDVTVGTPPDSDDGLA